MSRGVAIGAMLIATVGLAHADRREASLHVHVVGGRLTLGSAASTAGDGTGIVGGLAARASYATSNRYQYDAQLTLAFGSASFDEGTFTVSGNQGQTGPFTQSTQAARLDAGVTLRFGVALIPTVRVAVGVQGVRRGTPQVTVGGVTSDADTYAGALGFNPIATATGGLDYRINRRLIVGAAAGAVIAVPGVGQTWRGFEGTLHAAYYYYPRW